MTAPRALLGAWNLKARRRYGQNFLSDPATAEMIVARAGLSGKDIVVEIGAGLGALTVPCARQVEKVYAVETDKRITGLLRTELTAAGADNVAVLEADIMGVDLAELAGRHGRRLMVMGNLPYNIASQIVIRLIGFRHAVDRAVVMVQKEMAERLTAEPGGKTYGRISVVLQYCAAIDTVADVGTTVFFPRPKVDSRVLDIRFANSGTLSDNEEKRLFALVKAAFSKRRKTLKNALCASELHLPSEAALGALAAAGIDPVRRAETLTVDEFVRLNREIKQQ